jgi:hypothetical protein
MGREVASDMGELLEHPGRKGGSIQFSEVNGNTYMHKKGIRVPGKIR